MRSRRSGPAPPLNPRSTPAPVLGDGHAEFGEHAALGGKRKLEVAAHLFGHLAGQREAHAQAALGAAGGETGLHHMGQRAGRDAAVRVERARRWACRGAVATLEIFDERTLKTEVVVVPPNPIIR